MSDNDDGTQAGLKHLRAIARRLREADGQLSNAATDSAIELKDYELSRRIWLVSDGARSILRSLDIMIAQLNKEPSQ